MAIGMREELKKGQNTKAEGDKRESVDTANSLDSHKANDAAAADIITIDDEES